MTGAVASFISPLHISGNQCQCHNYEAGEARASGPLQSRGLQHEIFNTVTACLPTMIVALRSIQYTRGPQIVGRETFHSGSRNNLNLHFEFVILIRQNKCDHKA